MNLELSIVRDQNVIEIELSSVMERELLPPCSMVVRHDDVMMFVRSAMGLIDNDVILDKQLM